MREWGHVIDTEQRGRVAKETRCTDSRAQSHQSQRLGAKPDDKPAYTCCDRRAGHPQMPHLLEHLHQWLQPSKQPNVAPFGRLDGWWLGSAPKLGCDGAVTAHK